MISRCITILALMTTILAEARPTRIAVVLPVSDKNPKTVGNEVACGMTGVLEEAKKKGIDLEYKVFDNARDPVTTVSVANQAVKENFDIVLGTTLSSQAIVASKKDMDKNINFNSLAKPQIKSAVFEYIEAFYNRFRLHSVLDYRSPCNYESEHQ